MIFLIEGTSEPPPGEATVGGAPPKSMSVAASPQMIAFRNATSV